MARHRKLLILAAVLGLAIIGAGKLLVLAVLTLLLPVYALLLASIFLIVFIVLASVIVPIGHRLMDNNHVEKEESELEEPRRAA